MIPAESIDFAFSYHSFVDAGADVLRAYIAQLATKLRPEGVALLHHSNLGAFPEPSADRVQLPSDGWRDVGMNARGRRSILS